ncbi:MAG: hypothetical protein RSD08_09465 [Oscillospiraceae bacterium]
MQNYQKLHYAAYHIMLSDGSSIKTTRRECFAFAEPVTAENPFKQRWYYSPDCEIAIRLPRNEFGETLGKQNAADLKTLERVAERKNYCIAQTSNAKCTTTCDNCQFSDGCNLKCRAVNGVGCKRKCDCCVSYARLNFDIDKPLGFNDDGTEIAFELTDENVNIEGAYFETEQQDAIAAVIALLDPIDQELWRYLVQKIKKAEIAKLLHLTVDGVHYRQKRLEKLLRENETLKKIFANF